MVFERACAPEPAAPSSSDVAGRDGSASRSEGRPYTALRGRARFEGVFREGVRRRVGGVTLIARASAPGPSRVGVIAGRRVGTAVERNRARRRLREALAALPVPQGMDCVVVAAAEVNEVGFDRLQRWLTEAFEAITETEESTS